MYPKNGKKLGVIVGMATIMRIPSIPNGE